MFIPLLFDIIKEKTPPRLCANYPSGKKEVIIQSVASDQTVLSLLNENIPGVN